MKTYKVVKPVSDSKDNHRYYGAGEEILLDEARASVLLQRGVIAELEEEQDPNQDIDPDADPDAGSEDNDPADEPAAEAGTAQAPEPLLSGLFEKQDKEPAVTKEDKGKATTKAAPKGK